ncbi:GIY-YIG nuclease family protein [Hellea sp.]|nr:GIY-YIG nuclease family protein [Hellea sp.]
MEDKREQAGFRQFEFALTDALIAQLITCLDGMGTAELDPAVTSGIPNGQGVYQLFLDGKLVYIGKTDNEAGLQYRLQRHANLVSSRDNLTGGRVTFKAVQVLVFSAMELENMLIKHYAIDGKVPPWNNSGFGSNDPGRERDTTKYKADHFSVLYPISLNRLVNTPLKAGISVREALKLLKSELPFLLRFQGLRVKKSDLTETFLPNDISKLTVSETLKALLALLPTGWQATHLPGYIILYKENRDYAHGQIIARS